MYLAERVGARAHGIPSHVLEQLTTYIQTRLTDFSDYRTAADVELTHIGAIKTILSEAKPVLPTLPPQRLHHPMLHNSNLHRNAYTYAHS